MPTKILIVDDNEVGRRLLQIRLAHAGYDVVLADVPGSALELASTTPLDIVLSDIRMPGMTGLELLQRLRERQFDCEVILVTAYADVDTAIKALRLGACDYLVQPVDFEILLESIARAEHKLAQGRQRRAAVALMEAGLKHLMGQATPGPAAAGPAAEAARGQRYQMGPVLLDMDRFLIEVDGHRLDATPTEVEILNYLCRNADRVVKSQELVQSLRGYSVSPEEAAEIIRPHISNLRRKLVSAAPKGSLDDFIVTIRGVGYMLKTPPPA